MSRFLRRTILPATIAFTLALLVVSAYSLTVEAQSGATTIPHGKDGFEKCLDCHGLQGMIPEPANHAAFTVDTCASCHSYAEATPQTGEPEEEADSSSTCGKCHGELTSQYIDSVHGKALIEENNADVPSCTVCHTSHTEQDAGSEAFHTRSVALCMSCHANKELMQKYNISTNVVQSFLDDYHGATYTLITKQDKNAAVNTAVCTDCHGIHNIKPVDAPGSPVNADNLVDTCAKCHSDASTNFTATWLSHREPSINDAQLVFSVKWLYRIMIPFIVFGLTAHVALDLRRAKGKKQSGGK